MNRQFLNVAKQLKPQLSHENFTLIKKAVLNPGESALFDAGNHYTGYITVHFSSEGGIPDAPALVKIKFCEIAPEIDEDTSNYQGWISRSWIQEETVCLDVLPCKLKLPRRYAFRYVKIEALALSDKYRLVIDKVSVNAVTSAPETIECVGQTKKEKDIDRIALRTLRECMQYEFEDGPKRDRRLWLGDLRLQALANYLTYKHNDLVKRCLYLFAGTANKTGGISQCVFTTPMVKGDDSCMFDYSLLFVATLYDYFEATNDVATAEELLPIALKQLSLARERFCGDVVKDSDELGWCFLDWDLRLNKQCGAQMVYIYSAKMAIKLLKALGKECDDIERDVNNKTIAAIDAFYDETIGLFVCGEGRQVSYASNVWACLAEVFSDSQNAGILERLKSCDSAVEPVTPYMYHHYIQALINAGKQSEAKDTMLHYWGAMADLGADTFYELFDPKNPDMSPYGNKAVNSYCHAWSCTPAYFLRKYFVR